MSQCFPTNTESRLWPLKDIWDWKAGGSRGRKPKTPTWGEGKDGYLQDRGLLGKVRVHTHDPVQVNCQHWKTSGIFSSPARYVSADTVWGKL